MSKPDPIKGKFAKSITLVIAGVIVLLLLSFGIYSIAYAGKIYKNQYIGTLGFGGKNRDEAKALLKGKIEILLEKEVKLTVESEIYLLKASELGLAFDIDKTAQELWQAGRRSSITASIKEQIRSLAFKKEHRAFLTINEQVLTDKLAEIAKKHDQPESDFSLRYEDDKFVLNTDQKPGRRIDQAEASQFVRNELAAMKPVDYRLVPKEYKPQISREKAEATLKSANKILGFGEIELRLLADRYPIDLDTIASFIFAKPENDNLALTFNSERIQKYSETLAKSTNLEAKNAKIAMKEGKVTVFEKSQVGRTLDQNQTVADIKNTINARIDSGISSADPMVINLKAELTEPEIKDSEIDSLGIKELVGTAATDFKKSPANRVHNITVGANALNGILIKPGETFSTLSYLGKIDASQGYLEELVIKENRTVPEFGGGLCQVSSTLFRAALNSGLKITERQNHKYRVSYYEPPVGMDATIYDPAPDLKFDNNLKSHLLVQSKISGTKITFEFYGTKDNRKIEISAPQLFDIVEPEPPIVVETDTLPPGERKQIEKSHQGGTATFSYKVTAESGEVLQERNFRSKYVAWPEKWLVGKAVEPPLAPPTNCADGQQNGDEAGVDCGGSCPNQCSP